MSSFESSFCLRSCSGRSLCIIHHTWELNTSKLLLKPSILPAWLTSEHEFKAIKACPVHISSAFFICHFKMHSKLIQEHIMCTHIHISNCMWFTLYENQEWSLEHENCCIWCLWGICFKILPEMDHNCHTFKKLNSKKWIVSVSC